MNKWMVLTFVVLFSLSFVMFFSTRYGLVDGLAHEQVLGEECERKWARGVGIGTHLFAGGEPNSTGSRQGGLGNNEGADGWASVFSVFYFYFYFYF